ncbi:MAG: hypothetical protein Q8N37_02075 [bacterium]|nr:hypothetical protein [bacterium]
MDIIEWVLGAGPKWNMLFGIIVALLGAYVAINATTSSVNLFTKGIDQVIGLAIVGLGCAYAVIWHYEQREQRQAARPITSSSR